MGSFLKEIVFDLETLRGPDDVGGWEYAERFGLAVAVTWDEANGLREWCESDAQNLVADLARHERIIGFNVLNFDYKVLSAYEPNALRLLSNKTVDILDHVNRAIGFRVKLDDLAKATLGRGKTSGGEQALIWWKQGNSRAVVEYCQADVELTRDLYQYGVQNGKIYYPRFGEPQPISVTWKQKIQM